MKQVIFGKDGPEYLCVERKKVQNICKDAPIDIKQSVLYKLFGDKCLPDKPSVQVEPKKFFESDYGIGDKVIIAISSIGNPRKEVVTLLHQYQPQCEYSDYAKTWVVQTQDGMTYQSNEEHFEPYTEPEKGNDREKQGNNSEVPNLSQNSTENCDNENLNSKSDNMEEKEPNLCELLKDCKGEKFYSPCYGNVTLTEVRNDRIIVTADVNGKKHTFAPDGSHISQPVASYVMLVPSVELFQQHPLDPAKAWQIWKEARKSKHTLQAQIRLISNDGKTIVDYECIEVEVSDTDFAKATEAVDEVLQKFHEQNTDK